MTKVIRPATDERGGCKQTHPEDTNADLWIEAWIGEQTAGIREGVEPMALGVLSNLSAIYAENNLS
jgi:hypothetical protein